MTEVMQIMLPLIMLIQGIIYLWTGIMDWKRSKDPKELEKKKIMEEQRQIKARWKEVSQ